MRRPHSTSANHVTVVAASLCGLLAIAMLAGCGSSGQSDAPTPTPLPTPIVPEKPTYIIERGMVTRSLEFTGRVSPVEQRELFFRADGFVRSVYVQRDDRVRAGDLLADLEIGELENQLAQAQLDLAKAESRSADALAEARITLEKAGLQLQKALATDAQADVTAKQIALINAQEELKHAQDEYDKVVHRPWESDQVLDAYKRALTQAERSLTIAQAEYDRALAAQKSHAYDVELLKQEVALAELKLAQLQGQGEQPVNLDIEQAKLDVKKIEDKIAAATLVAPFDGRVLSLNIRPGSSVQGFKVVALVGDPEELEITADLDAGDVSELSVKQPATIRLRNRPEGDLAGFVRQLPYPGGDIAGAADQDTAVHVALNDPSVSLELGELATVTVILEKKDSVLWLPPAAIRSFQGRDFVVIQDGDSQRRIDVRLGIRSAGRIEMVEGVQAGQIVVGP